MDAILTEKAERLAKEIATQAKTLDDLNGLIKLMMKSAAGTHAQHRDGCASRRSNFEKQQLEAAIAKDMHCSSRSFPIFSVNGRRCNDTQLPMACGSRVLKIVSGDRRICQAQHCSRIRIGSLQTG